MASQWYGKGLEAFATKTVDWLTDNIKCVLVDSASYTLSINTDTYLSDIPAPARIATTANLASKTAALGVLKAADTVFSSVSGATSEYIVVYQDTGTASTSRLLFLYDSGGLPITPNGNNINVTWNASGLAAL